MNSVGITTSNNTCRKSIKNPYMHMDQHIRKFTVSELYEFLASAHICFSARHRGSLVALSLELGWHALLRS